MKRLLFAVAASSTLLSLAAPTFASSDGNGNGRMKRWNNPPLAVPELGLGVAGAAVVLLGGGLLVANGRRRKKP